MCLFLIFISLSSTLLLQFDYVDADEITHYHIKGNLHCVHREGEQSKAPVVGSAVELWDYDFIRDDLLGTAYTDENGNFELIGEDGGDWGPPEPYLYARCGDEWFYCCLYTHRVEQSVIMQNGRCTHKGERRNAMIKKTEEGDIYMYPCKKYGFWEGTS